MSEGDDLDNPPAFQLYAADFYMDTVGWSATQVGVYFRLLLHEWINGPLPTSIGKLSRIAGIDPRNMQKVWSTELAKKFTTDDAGMYINQRLEKTRMEQQEYREKLVNSGRLGGLETQKKKRIASSKASSEASSENEALQSSVFSLHKKQGIKDKILYLDFVFLKEDEYSKLVDQFGEQGAKDRIYGLNVYLGSTEKKYKSHYFTILNWERRNENGASGGNIKKRTIPNTEGDTGAGKYHGLGEVLD